MKSYRVTTAVVVTADGKPRPTIGKIVVQANTAHEAAAIGYATLQGTPEKANELRESQSVNFCNQTNLPCVNPAAPVLRYSVAGHITDVQEWDESDFAKYLIYDGTEMYEVNALGQIRRTGVNATRYSDQWKAVALLARNNFGKTVDSIQFSEWDKRLPAEVDQTYKNGKFKMALRDFDHGTVRTWGKPVRVGRATRQGS